MAKQEEVTEVVDGQEVAPEAVEIKRPRKLGKDILGNLLTITEKTTGQTLTFELAHYSDDIADKLAMYGLSQKLGDAAAGKTGQDIIDAINKVNEGLLANDWSIRAPAAPKVTKKDINEKISAMSAEDAAAVKESLAKLGFSF